MQNLEVIGLGTWHGQWVAQTKKRRNRAQNNMESNEKIASMHSALHVRYVYKPPAFPKQDLINLMHPIIQTCNMRNSERMGQPKSFYYHTTPAEMVII